LRKRRVRERDAHLLPDLEKEDCPSAEQLCIEAQERARIHAAVQELPPKCRQAFTLVQFHDLEYADVAAQMGVTQTAARQLVCRAIEHLAKAIVGTGPPKRRRDEL
jgi:RNA polymerase sigma-70 factor (ECF subfamily)